MAESILKYELDRNEGAYISIVRNVIEQTMMAHNVVLHLPPNRFDQLTAGEQTSFVQEMDKQGVALVRDPGLDATDCLVTCNMGNIKGGVKTQLARIKQAAAGQGMSSL